MYSPVLQQNLCVTAPRGLVLIVSEWLLEKLAHTATAGPCSRTYVCNLTVPVELKVSLPRFTHDVWQIQCPAVPGRDDGRAEEKPEDDGPSEYEILRAAKIKFNTSVLNDVLGLGAPSSSENHPTTGSRHKTPRPSDEPPATNLRRSRRLTGGAPDSTRLTEGAPAATPATFARGTSFGPDARLLGGRNARRGSAKDPDRRLASKMMPFVSIIITENDGKSSTFLADARPIAQVPQME